MKDEKDFAPQKTQKDISADTPEEPWVEASENNNAEQDDRGKKKKKKKAKAGESGKAKTSKSTIILGIVFIIGLSLLLYPSLSNYWNSIHAARAITDYNEAIADMTEEDFDAYWEAARTYNASLLDNSGRYTMSAEEEARYNSLLNITDDGMMGYIEIPSIRVDLPVYHGVEEETLTGAAGHLPGSSLPVGGASTHCVLSGHRGLPSAKLFTNLDRLQEGDTFMLTILNDTLTYEVDQIRIVLPDELYDLEITEGEDYCTLVTCTPYGINTHRLLVRGHRVETTEDANVTNEGLRIEPMLIAPVLAVPVLIILFIVLLIKTRRKPQQKKKDLRTSQEKLRDMIDSRLDMEQNMTEGTDEASGDSGISGDSPGGDSPQT